MLSETLTTGLERYRIGPKVRALRQEKKLGLIQLGEHTGLSPAMLSKIERGQMFPTLPTLLRIALVFGVGLDHFFVNQQENGKLVVIRKRDRLRLPNQPNAQPPSYLFESLDFAATDRRMQAYYAEFPVRSKPSEPHSHDGAEFIYILKGQLGLDIDGNEFALEEGDAMYFEADKPHSYRRRGKGAAAAIVVVAR